MIEGLTTSNKGTLINPAREIPRLELHTLDGKTFNTASLQNNWTLLLVADSACDADCEKNLFHLRQIRLAMGEERSRIQRLMLLTDTDETKALKNIIEAYDGTHVITGPPEANTLLLSL